MTLAGGEHRRHDDRAGVHRAAFERVVEILAVDRGAVDQRRSGGRQRAHMPDGGARPVIVAGRERGFNVILIARGDRQADHIDQQIFALAPHGLRQMRCVEPRNRLGKALRNGSLWEIRR